MVKNILFDWSGVINNNTDDFIQVISNMFKANGGRKITRRELRQKWTQPYMKFYNLYFPKWSLTEQRKHYLNSIHKFKQRKIFPGMRTLLYQLKREEYKLYVLSGDLPRFFRKEMKEYGLEKVFDKIILDLHDKTDDLIQLIKDEKLKLNETVFIGDTVHEIECAKAANIKSIAVSWGMNTPSILKTAQPTYLVHSTKELKKIIFIS